MRTRLQALLSSTALAAAIGSAALMSSGSTRFANADEITDAVKDRMTALLSTASASDIPEATRTAINSALNGTSDGAALMTQLTNLAGQNAALANTIGTALGQAATSLQTNNPGASTQIQSFVVTSNNSSMTSGFTAAKGNASIALIGGPGGSGGGSGGALGNIETAAGGGTSAGNQQQTQGGGTFGATGGQTTNRNTLVTNNPGGLPSGVTNSNLASSS
jgi:hypothetical protein